MASFLEFVLAKIPYCFSCSAFILRGLLLDTTLHTLLFLPPGIHCMCKWLRIEIPSLLFYYYFLNRQICIVIYPIGYLSFTCPFHFLEEAV
jgi:hypothetical protein